MRINDKFVILICGTAILHGCGGGGQPSRVAPETEGGFLGSLSPEYGSSFWNIAKDGFKDFGKSANDKIVVDDKSKLNYFGFTNPDQIKYLSAKGYDGKYKVFKGPFLAEAPSSKHQPLDRGLYFRIWHSNKCGEVLGIFIINDKKYVVDVLMSKSDEWSATRGNQGLVGALNIGKVKPECAHSDRMAYSTSGVKIGPDHFLYKKIFNDITIIPKSIQPTAALTAAVLNMAMIVSNIRLSDSAREIWNEDSFVNERQLLMGFEQFSELPPRVVVVTAPSE